MQQKHFLGSSPLGFHRTAYTEWGHASERPPVICVHGLTRNGHDFDKLAAALQKDRQVLCVDIVGRGKSDWLANPDFYDYPQYVADMTALVARAGHAQVDWVGTSMGGIIGMLMAAMPNSPIRRLVVNDVGPFIPLAALKRIGDYVSITPEFADLEQAERYMRQIYEGFGIANAADWRHMAEHGVRRLPNGKLTLAYDPAIGKKFTTLHKDTDFWDVYDRIACPMLLLRGTKSDILSFEVAQDMTRRGPQPQLVEFPGIGHAPSLMEPTQIDVISEFLNF